MRRLTGLSVLCACVVGLVGAATVTAAIDRTAAASKAAAAVANGLIAYEGPKRDGDRVLSFHVWVMNPDGTARRLITPPTIEGAELRPDVPKWSPDGTRIAFTGDLFPLGGGIKVATRLFVMNADGSGLRAIATVNGHWTARPTWSPAGTEVAYVDEAFISTGWGKAIRAAKVDGSGTRTVALESLYDFWLGTPAWAPDGRAIGYLRHRGARTGEVAVPPTLWLVAADGTNARPMVDLPIESDHRWAISGWPSVGQLELNRSRSSLPRLFEPFLIGADGSGLRQIPDLLLTGPPEFSPDGKLVVFDSSGGIRLIAVDPSARRQNPGGRELANDGGSPDWQHCRRPEGCLLPSAANRRPTLTVRRLWVQRAGGERKMYISFVACDQVGDELSLFATATKLGGPRRTPVTAAVPPSVFQSRSKRCKAYRTRLYTSLPPPFYGRGLYRFRIQLWDRGNPDVPARLGLKSKPVIRTIRFS